MRFLSIVFGVISVLYVYLGWSLFWPIPAIELRIFFLLLLLSIFAMILWVPIVLWRKEELISSKTDILIQWFAFSGVGVLSFVLILTLGRDLVLAFSSNLVRSSQSTWFILLSSVLLFGFGFVKARFRTKICKVDVPLSELPTELSGLKILQISDLHVGPTIKKDFVQRVVEVANATEPDLIVLTGDIVDGTVKDLSEHVEPLALLKAQYGKYYITGNHEYYWEGPEWIQKFKELGMTPLLNQNEVLHINNKTLAIAGIPDPTATSVRLEGPQFKKSLQGIPEDAYPRILLCHQPKFITQTEKHGYTLQLSGHTHGGQFFPWTLIASLVHQFPYGLHQFGKTLIYVSRGTGYWGPPVRLGSPSEITLLTLRRNSSPSSL